MSGFLEARMPGGADAQTERREAFRIAVLYAVFGVLWILFSDRAMMLIANDQADVERISMFKGWFYVIVTAIFIYTLALNSFLRLLAARRRLADSLAEQRQLNAELLQTNSELTQARLEIEQAHARLQEANQELEKTNGLLAEANGKLEGSNRELEETNCMLEEEITEHMNAETRLLAARDEAVRANEAKSRFLSNMSHEIRTPLNGIVGMTELLAMDAENGRQKEHLQLVKRSADSLLAIINDILDYSRMEEGGMQLVLAPFRPAQIVSDVVHMFHVTAEGKSLRIITEMGAGLPEHLAGDAVRIRQILTNLVGNAVKFTERGHVKVSLSAWPDETKEHPEKSSELPTVRLRIVVEDTGIGIARDKQHLLFERFSQVDSSYAKHYQGTGLGLVITRRLVELMRGSIRMESEHGRGSTFLVEIPMPVAVLHRDNAGS